MPLSPEKQAELDHLNAVAAGAPPAPVAEPQQVPAPQSDAAVTSLSVAPAGTPIPPTEVPIPAPQQEPIKPIANQAPPGFFASLYETAFPSGPAVKEEHEKLKDWTKLPELWHISTPSALALLGTIASGPDQTEKVLKEQFGVTARKDGRYILFKSKEDGKEYAWKPGIHGSDWARAGAGALATLPATLGAAALAPAGAAGAIGAGALGSMAGVGGLEMMKAAAGGDFQTGQVLAAGALGGLVPALGKAGQTAWSFARGEAPAALPPVVQTAQAAELQARESLAAKMAAAARNPAGPEAADVAAQVKPDPAVFAAAQRRGVLDRLQPEHVSTNDTFQELGQSIPGAPARNARALDALGQSLDQALKESGARSSPGAVDYTAKEAIKKQIEEAKALFKRLYKEVFGEKGVGGLVKGETPTPPTKFLAEVERIKSQQNGTIPKAVKKVVADLYPAGEEVTPTASLVDRTRKQLGAGVKGKGTYGKALQSTGEAHALFEALDADQLAAAELNGAGAKFREAQEAFKNHAAMVKETVAVLGKQGERSLAGQAGSAVEGLPYVAPDGFDRVMRVTTEPLRPDVAKQSLFQFIKNNGELDARGFVQWFGDLKAAEKSYNALMTHLGPDLRTALHDLYDVARSVAGAMSKSGTSASLFPAADKVGGAGTRALGWIVDNTLGRGANMMGVPSPPGGFTRFALARLSGADKPITDALVEFITSPAGRAGMHGAASGAPIPAGRLASIAASPTFRHLMDAANVPASARQRWLEQALTATVAGSPARAGATQQPEEAQ